MVGGVFFFFARGDATGFLVRCQDRVMVCDCGYALREYICGPSTEMGINTTEMGINTIQSIEYKHHIEYKHILTPLAYSSAMKL